MSCASTFELWPTTIIDADGKPVDELQAVHYDALLSGFEDERLREEGVLFEDEDLEDDARVVLGPQIDRFRALFEPRMRR